MRVEICRNYARQGSARFRSNKWKSDESRVTILGRPVWNDRIDECRVILFCHYFADIDVPRTTAFLLFLRVSGELSFLISLRVRCHFASERSPPVPFIPRNRSRAERARNRSVDIDFNGNYFSHACTREQELQRKNGSLTGPRDCFRKFGYPSEVFSFGIDGATTAYSRSNTRRFSRFP